MTSPPRYFIRWDRDSHEWIVTSDATRVGAFSKAYEAMRFCGGDFVLDLREHAEVEAP